MTKCARLSIDSAEEFRLTDARAGVAMTMSGESASSDRWTASETFCVRLIARMSFAQNVENDSTTLKTCSASSRVGTRMRAEVHGAEDV